MGTRNGTRSLVAGATTAGAATAEVGADATVAEAVVAAEVVVDTDAPPDARMGLTTQLETAEEMAAPTTAMEGAEEAEEVVDMVVGAEAPARGAWEREATATPRVEGTTGAPTKPAPAAPRRTAEMMTTDEVATFGAAEPPKREAMGTSRGEVTEAEGRTRAKAATALAAPVPLALQGTTERTPTSLS